MGAYQKLPLTEKFARHGYQGTPTYRSWVNMRTRCENPRSTQWKWYGARGIQVCERWKTFGLFLEDMGERPSTRHTLDRINAAENYEPGNVRWATHVVQCRNRKSNRRVVRSDGAEFGSLAEAAESVGGNLGSIWDVCNRKRTQYRGYGWSYAA